MPRIRKRPNEPIAPTQIPGGHIDPKVPDDVDAETDREGHAAGDASEREHIESDEEQQARESEKAFDQAITRIPPG